MNNLDFDDRLCKRSFSQRGGYMEKTIDGDWISRDFVNEKLNESRDFWLSLLKTAEANMKRTIKVWKIMAVSSFFINVILIMGLLSQS